MLLLAPLRAKAGDISFDPSITAAEFQKFSRVVAQGIYATPMQPGGASGLLRFDVGVGATGVRIDENASWYRKAVDGSINTGAYVGVPRIIVSKGLGAAAASASYAKLGDQGAIWGASLDVPIIDGGLVKPTLALRGVYTDLRGVEQYQQKVYGVEALLGKGIGPVTPYASVGRMRSDATGTATGSFGTPVIRLHDQSDINRYTLGVRISLALPKIVIEATQAEERSYSAKVSFGF